MKGPDSISRRRLLGGVTGLLVTGALAGCTGDDENEGTETDTENGGESTETPATDELDLREANVVGVSLDHESGDQRT